MPEFWTFLNNLNPLEVLRSYLNDRHERSKDYVYREHAEAEKLRIENSALELQNIQLKIKILENLGASQQDLHTLKEILQCQIFLEILGHERILILMEEKPIKLRY